MNTSRTTQRTGVELRGERASAFTWEVAFKCHGQRCFVGTSFLFRLNPTPTNPTYQKSLYLEGSHELHTERPVQWGSIRTKSRHRIQGTGTMQRSTYSRVPQLLHPPLRRHTPNCTSLLATLLETAAQRPRLLLIGKNEQPRTEIPGHDHAPATAKNRKIHQRVPTAAAEGALTPCSRRTSSAPSQNRRQLKLLVRAPPPFRVMAQLLGWRPCRRQALTLAPGVLVPPVHKTAGAARWSLVTAGFEIRGCRKHREAAIQGVREATLRLPPARGRGAGIAQGVEARELSRIGEGSPQPLFGSGRRCR